MSDSEPVMLLLHRLDIDQQPTQDDPDMVMADNGEVWIDDMAA